MVQASRWWHGILFIVVAASFIAQLILIFQGGADVNAGESATQLGVGARLVNLFSFFTIQSNLLVLAVAASLVLNPRRDGPLWRVVRLDAILGIVITGIVITGIVITGIVFATILAGLVHHEGAAVWINAGFHYFSPWWTPASS